MKKPITSLITLPLFSSRLPASKHTRGFTLIELMIVVAIIGILAAIALPNYRRYAVSNAERDAQAKMLQLQIQLEQWRARALSYQGFTPQKLTTVNGATTTTYAYDDTDNKIIYVPNTASASNYRYKITVVDGVATTNSLVATGIITGRSWKMLAEPNTTGLTKGANNIVLASNGLRCQNSATITISAVDCGAGQKEW